ARLCRGRVRAPRADPSQYLRQLAARPRRPVPGAPRAADSTGRPDHGRRGLPRVGRDRPGGGARPAPRTPPAAPRVAARDDRPRRTGASSHRVGPGPLPARQRPLRPVRAARSRAAQARAPGRLRGACGARAGGVEGAVRDLIRRFVEHIAEERGLSPHTVTGYGRDLERFAQFLSRDFLDGPLDQISGGDVDRLAVRAFLAALARDGVGPRSQGRALAALRTFFAWACRVGELPANPARGVRTPKAP